MDGHRSRPARGRGVLARGGGEPTTIRPADLLEPQVEAARQQLRKMNLDTSDDSVLNQLLFPNLAIDYLREPAPAPRENKRSAAVTTSDGDPAQVLPATAPPPVTPTAPTAPPAAEFDVEVDGEVFKVRVSGGGMIVTAGATGAGRTAHAPTGG